MALRGEPCRLGILLSGNGTNMQNIAEHIEKVKLRARIMVVISDVEDAYGLVRARRHGLTTFHINPASFSSRDAYEKDLIRVLEENSVELVILAGYMRLVGREFVNAFRGRIMNIHPALLPSFPGTRGVADALAYGVKVTGVTVHFVDEGLDTGPIILQEVVSVLPDDTEETLHQRIHEVEYRLFPQAIQYFSEGRLHLDGRRTCILKKGEEDPDKAL